MTQLLVSVRNRHEAFAALEGGAQIIDVKEPRRGALGAGSTQQLREVAEAVGGQRPLSAALGELLDDPRRRLKDLCGYSFVKVGMAGCGQVPAWSQKWSDLVDRAPPDVAVVAVIYADYRLAAAPSPHEIIDEASRLDISFLLIDTFDKSAGSLLTHFCFGDLQDIFAAARLANMKIAVAGSLTSTSLPAVLPLRPDYVAVRGAVCRRGRTGQIHAALVRQIARQLSTTCGPCDRSLRYDFVDSDVRES